MSKRKPKVLPEVKSLMERAEAAGISMLKVCRAAGVHHDTFGRWRRGERSPLVTTLGKLNTTLTDLITDVKPPAHAARSRPAATAR